MQVSELAERAGVPLATVKYYLREGLLPPGETTGPRRAEYDEAHLRRLRVLRLLREVGGVPVTSLRGVVEALDDGPCRSTR
jgi:DNA-binding transcriptional MerR regulator